MEKITFKDKRALNMFRVCGNCTETQLNSIISLNRIKNWQAEGLIKKESYIDKSISKTKSCKAYRLTDKGKQVACKALHKDKGSFTTGKHQIRHNIAVAEQYTKLDKESQIDAMNESDQYRYYTDQALQLIEHGHKDEGEELLEQLQTCSFLDMVVITETETIAIEIATSNYTSSDLIEHQHTSTIIQATSYQVVSI